MIARIRTVRKVRMAKAISKWTDEAIWLTAGKYEQLERLDTDNADLVVLVDKETRQVTCGYLQKVGEYGTKARRLEPWEMPEAVVLKSGHEETNRQPEHGVFELQVFG